MQDIKLYNISLDVVMCACGRRYLWGGGMHVWEVGICVWICMCGGGVCMYVWGSGRVYVVRWDVCVEK